MTFEQAVVIHLTTDFSIEVSANSLEEAEAIINEQIYTKGLSSLATYDEGNIIYNLSVDYVSAD